VTQIKYLGTTVTNQNLIWRKIWDNIRLMNATIEATKKRKN
jgi:hypothetical protein